MTVFAQRVLDSVGRELWPGAPVRRRGERVTLGTCIFVWPWHWFGDGKRPEVEVQGDDGRITTHRAARQTTDGHFKFDLALVLDDEQQRGEGG